MRAGDLKQLLRKVDDDARVLIECHADYATELSDGEVVRSKELGKLGSWMAYNYQSDSWDTTKQYSEEPVAILLTASEYYIRAQEKRL